MKIMFVAIGSLFAFIGGFLLGIGAVGGRAMKKSRRVNAKIVDFKEEKWVKFDGTAFDPYEIVHLPVYEYYDGGEIKRYTSQVYNSRKKPIGTEVTLYISEDGKVRDGLDSKIMYLVGGGLAAMGALFAVIGLFLP